MERRSRSRRNEGSRRVATEKCVRMDHERFVSRMFGIDPGKFSVCDQGWSVNQLRPSYLTHGSNSYHFFQSFSVYRALSHRRRGLRGVSVIPSLGLVDRQLLTVRQKIGLCGECMAVPMSISSARLRFLFASIMGQLTLVRFRVGRRLRCVILYSWRINL